jgi:alpha-galactosidase
MTISYKSETREFHLRNEGLSYIIAVLEDGRLGQLHFGAPLADLPSYRHLVGTRYKGFERGGGDYALLEYPSRGTGDFRIPAIEVLQADGSRLVDPRYVGHRILPGKGELRGLPSTYVEEEAEAATLEIDLVDAPSALSLTLSYTIFRDVAAVARSVRIRNGGSSSLRLECAMSASLDLPDGDWELLSYDGAWARERVETRRGLAPGTQGVYSVRGASSHQANPFLVLARPGADEARGEALGFSLVYSGNFLAEAELGPFRTTRLRLGIEPTTFSWLLESGSEFQCPEAVIARSGSGLGGLSEAYHRLYRERLARGVWRDRPRPVLINNWEGTYWDFTEDKLLAIARAARGAGVELFVLDDGWFGRRDDDTSSLGDWDVDKRKLPEGIEALARSIEALGMKFGIWMEPEMVNPRSRLFEARPEWAVGAPGRERTTGRNQYVLDFSNPEVVDYIHGAMSSLLRSAPISYLKWDMNRNITEAYGATLPPERQGEFFHRYMLGVYELYRRITNEFPELLIESCAGGGGRFDPGILAYAPQAWTSDDTDAAERLRIQWGSSVCYPLSSMGAHLSASPNHQTGRLTSLGTRAAVAFFGVFGYELDASTLSPGELAELSAQIVFYKEHRELFQRGSFHRLRSPYEGEGDLCSWACVSTDKRRAVVGVYRLLNRPNPWAERFPLRGLDSALRYRVSLWPEPVSRGDYIRLDNEGLRGGDELMAVGLAIADDPGSSPARGDFWSQLFVLEAERA